MASRVWLFQAMPFLTLKNIGLFANYNPVFTVLGVWLGLKVPYEIYHGLDRVDIMHHISESTIHLSLPVRVFPSKIEFRNTVSNGYHPLITLIMSYCITG